MSRICLDLNVLRTFVAGVDLGSFAKAADRVGRSQSAVSSQLSKLNALAGKPVVRKAGRGLALTEAGEVTLSYARRLLDLNDEAVMAIQDAKLQGWVRFGLPQDFAENWLPEALGNFARAHLGVRVEVVAGRNAELLPRVGAGSLDLALAWGEPDGPHADRVAELPMVWIGPAKGAPLWDVGEAVPVIALDAPCRFRSAGTSALGAAGISWRLAFSSGSLSGSWAAVAAVHRYVPMEWIR